MQVFYKFDVYAVQELRVSPVSFLVIVASVATWTGTEMCNYQPTLLFWY